MDTSDPNIRFDANGYCNHCTDYLENKLRHSYRGAESDAHFRSLIQKIKRKGKNKKYDCVIGISGGLDSCFTAYLIKQQGLRPLLVHMDNGWDTPGSVQNIQSAVNKLSVGYESYVLDWEEFRDLQVAFLKASVIEAETPTDMAIPGALHRIAAKNGIKYIVSGCNFATEGLLPRHWHYNSNDLIYLKGVHKKFGKMPLKKFPFFGLWREAYYKFFKRIKMVYPLNYIPYSNQMARTLMQKELNWREYGAKHHESKYTAFIQSYLLPIKFDLDYRKATLSSQICNGEKTKEEALEILKTLPYDPEKIGSDIAYVSKKLNLTLEEMNNILHSAPKTYRDYPNAERFLEPIYAIYRKIFRPR